jgi:hypothetical protein
MANYAFIIPTSFVTDLNGALRITGSYVIMDDNNAVTSSGSITSGDAVLSTDDQSSALSKLQTEMQIQIGDYSMPVTFITGSR